MCGLAISIVFAVWGIWGLGLEPVCGFACLSAPFMFWGSTACRSAAFRHLMVNCIPLLVIQTRSNNTCAQCVRMSVLTLPSEEKGVGKAQMEDRHGLQLQKRTLTLLTLWPLTPRRALMRSYGAPLMNSQWSPWTDLSQILKVRCVARCALWPAWGPNDRPSWDPCWSSRCFSVLMRPPCQNANMTCLEISCHQRCHMVSCSVHFLWSMYVNWLSMCQIYSGWAFVTGEYVRIEMNWKSSETFPGLGLRVIRAPEGASCKKAVVSLFGVFDGHSGATLMCSSNLFNLLKADDLCILILDAPFTF